MHLDRLIAALGPIEVANAAPLEIAELAYDTRAVPPGSLFFCVPGRSCRRARARGRRRRARARRRSSSSDSSTSRCRSSSSRACARRCRSPRPCSSATRPASSTSPGSPGRTGRRPRRSSSRAILDAAGAQPALLTNIERRIGGELRPTGLNTPESIDLQRLFREMLDAGDRSCVMEATSIAGAKGRLDGTRFAVLVFTNLTQDHLDFHGSMEEYYAAKRALFDAGRAGRRERRRRVGARGSRASCPARDVHAGDALGGIDLKLRGALQPRERARCDLGGARARRRRGRDQARDRVASPACPGRFESVDAGQPFAVIVDYAHTPDSLENVLRAARDLGERVTVVFGAGGDRDREKRPLMGGSPPRSPTARSSPRTTRARRIPRRSRRTSPRAARDRARPARRDRDGARRRTSGRRGRDRGQGRRHRDGARRPEHPVRRPAGRARGAGVIPVELDVVERFGRVVARPWADEVTGVQIDSRRIAEGDLFVAVSSGARLRRARARPGRRRGARARGRARGARRHRIGRARAVAGARRRDHRLDREDLDEGHPFRDVRTARSHARQRRQLQQRARRAADVVPPRARHRALHHRARDERARADRDLACVGESRTSA